MGRGKGHGSLANLYHGCKKLGHTIRLFLVISSLSQYGDHRKDMHF